MHENESDIVNKEQRAAIVLRFYCVAPGCGVVRDLVTVVNPSVAL